MGPIPAAGIRPPPIQQGAATAEDISRDGAQSEQDAGVATQELPDRRADDEGCHQKDRGVQVRTDQTASAAAGIAACPGRSQVCQGAKPLGISRQRSPARPAGCEACSIGRFQSNGATGERQKAGDEAVSAHGVNTCRATPSWRSDRYGPRGFKDFSRTAKTDEGDAA